MANNLPLKSVLPIDGVGVDLGTEIRANTTLSATYLAADAVTTAKILDANVTTDKLADDAVTSAKVDPLLIQYVAVPLSAANIIAMNATPIELIAAPGASKSIRLHDLLFRITRTSTAFTGGGAVVVQYETGPVAAINTIADTVITGGAGVENVARTGIDAAIGVDNLALEITNATAAFADGTGTAVVHLWYSIV